MSEQQSGKKAVVLTITLVLAAVAIVALFIFPPQSDTDNPHPAATKHPSNLREIHYSQHADNNAVTPFKSASEDLTSDVSGIAELEEQDIKMIASRAQGLMEVPMHPWRKKLLGNIRSETMEQTLRNFANFDDCSLAETTISGYDSSEACAEFQKRVVVRLMRVRKVLAYGREHPEEVVPTLRQLLRDSLLAWPATYEKRQQDWADGIRTYEKPDAYLRSQKTCLAAAYILAELGDYQALPLLAHQYHIHHPWPPPIIRAPVPPAITFYAMHRLASSHPRGALSSEAAQALDQYLAATECLPPPEETTVTVWSADYSESDPRLLITRKKKEVLQGQSVMTMPVYPTQFKDGSDMQDSNGKTSKELDALFSKLDAFVRLAYPDRELSLP